MKVLVRFIVVLLVTLSASQPFNICAQEKQTPSQARPSSSITVTPTPKPRRAVNALPRTANIRRPSPQVVAVIHRLSGSKLSTWLDPNEAKDNKLDVETVYTKVIAGYVINDGQTIIARLPQADAQALNYSQMFSFYFTEPGAAAKFEPQSSELLIVAGGETYLKANFVGMDASTRLSLLRTSNLNVAPSREVVEASLAVGQRVHLFAPERLKSTLKNGQSTVYFSFAEIEGRLTEIKRTATGNIARLKVNATGLTASMVGAVVLNDAGEMLGIVEMATQTEARVLPVSMVKRAANRVLARQSSVPQPWLGVSGEAVAATSLRQFVSGGWQVAEATRLMNQQRGILLTKVGPGTPAALADLRVGDVITRFNNSFIKNAEDFSFLLNEAGSNASVYFTVLRAQSKPRQVQVKLSEALNAARASSIGVPQLPPAVALPKAQNMGAPQANMVIEPQIDIEPLTPMEKASRDSLIADLDYVIVPAQENTRYRAHSVLLVNAVRPGGTAEQIGLRAGDFVVAVDGQKLSRDDWGRKFLLRKIEKLSLEVLRGEQRLTLVFTRKEE
jgi:S1-C subfamily serine protease